MQMDFSRARLWLFNLVRGEPRSLRSAIRTIALSLGLLAAAAVSASSVTYTYDDLGRLTLAAYDNGSRVVYTLDAAGNRVSVAQTLDTTPPVAPTGLTGAPTSASNIHLTWTACTDTSGSLIAGYKIYRAGTQIGTSSSAAYDDGTVIGSTTYTYTVACYDNANNFSAQSAPATVQSQDTTPPTVPAGLTASSTSSTVVNLSWGASTDSGGSGLAGYQIYRAGSQIGTSATTSYSDTTTVGTTAYGYTVAAYDHIGNASAQTATVNITTPDTIAPSTPTGLAATAPASGRVNLTWSAATDTGGSGLAGYKIYRGGTQIGTSGTTSYSDTTTLGTTSYTYTVAAYDNATPTPNTSAQSSPVGVTTPDTIAPSVPTGLTATVISANQVNLSWSPSTDTGGSGLQGYIVWRNGFGVTGSPATSTSAIDNTVSGSTTYSYTVAAYDNATPIVNESAQSTPPVIVTTPSNVPSSPGLPQPHGKVTTMSWTESWAASTGPVAYYVLVESGGATGTFTITAPTTTHAQSGGNGLSYSFAVKACNSSNQCSATVGPTSVNICAGGVCP